MEQTVGRKDCKQVQVVTEDGVPVLVLVLVLALVLAGDCSLPNVGDTPRHLSQSQEEAQGQWDPECLHPEVAKALEGAEAWTRRVGAGMLRRQSYSCRR